MYQKTSEYNQEMPQLQITDHGTLIMILSPRAVTVNVLKFQTLVACQKDLEYSADPDQTTFCELQPWYWTNI